MFEEFGGSGELGVECTASSPLLHAVRALQSSFHWIPGRDCQPLEHHHEPIKPSIAPEIEAHYLQFLEGNQPFPEL